MTWPLPISHARPDDRSTHAETPAEHGTPVSRCGFGLRVVVVVLCVVVGRVVVVRLVVVGFLVVVVVVGAAVVVVVVGSTLVVVVMVFGCGFAGAASPVPQADKIAASATTAADPPSPHLPRIAAPDFPAGHTAGPGRVTAPSLGRCSRSRKTLTG
jgi:hypothetical protein